VKADDPKALKAFLDANQTALASDHEGDPVFLARNAWHLDRAIQDHPDIQFLKTKEFTH
jgi:peptide chain release factor 3